MEETISGFKTRGRWSEIVEHGERITRALLEEEANVTFPDDFEEWEAWRPKPHERIDTDVNKKTADQASVDEGKGEQAGKSAEDDLRTAGDRLAESYKELEEDDATAAVSKWTESIDYVARAADSAGRKALRSVENTVYRRVMTQLAPYFFDNELISANLQRSRRGEGPEFIFEVNVNEDRLKDRVSTRLAEYEDTIDRWHVESEKSIEVASVAEGHEVTETELKATTARPPAERVSEPIDPHISRPEVIEGEHPEKGVPPSVANGDEKSEKKNDEGEPIENRKD